VQGYAADITLIDPAAEWQLDEHSCCSAGHNTPFWQQPLKGRVMVTLVDGEIRFQAAAGLPGTGGKP
jgi:dihydroorotase